MKISGQIEDFSPTDIMQYVYASKKTGALHFKKGEHSLSIFFREGHIIRAIKSGMTNIGDILLKLGKINYENLKKAIYIQQTSQDKKLFGNILKEMGVITQNDVKEALISQIREVIEELLAWREGEFSMELGDFNASDDILVAFSELDLLKDVNTESILLDAAKVYDEKNEHESVLGKRADAPSVNSQFNPTVLGKGKQTDAPEISPENIKKTKSNIASIKEMITERREQGDDFSVSNSLLNIIGTYCNRAILFLNAEKDLLAIGSISRAGGDLQCSEEVKGLRIPLEKDSLLSHCIKNRSAYLGSMPEQPWTKHITKAIKQPRNPEILILPISGIERDVCLLYGDEISCAIDRNDLDLLEVAASQVGIILENHLLQKQLEGTFEKMFKQKGEKDDTE